MRHSVYILVYGALGSLNLYSLDCLLKLFLGRLHQGRVECSAHLERKGTLGTCCLELLASGIDSVDIAAYYELARAVVVGCHNDVAVCARLLAYFFYLLIGQTDNSSHSARSSLACLLHSHSTGSYELDAILK